MLRIKVNHFIYIAWLILYSRHGIHQVRALALFLVPVLEHILKTTLPTSKHTFVIDSDRNNVDTPGPGGLYGIHVCVLLDQHTFLFLD